MARNLVNVEEEGCLSSVDEVIAVARTIDDSGVRQFGRVTGVLELFESDGIRSWSWRGEEAGLHCVARLAHYLSKSYFT